MLFRSRLGMMGAHRRRVTLAENRSLEQGSENYQDGAAIGEFLEECVNPTGARSELGVSWQMGGECADLQSVSFFGVGPKGSPHVTVDLARSKSGPYLG